VTLLYTEITNLITSLIGCSQC